MSVVRLQSESRRRRRCYKYEVLMMEVGQLRWIGREGKSLEGGGGREGQAIREGGGGKKCRLTIRLVSSPPPNLSPPIQPRPPMKVSGSAVVADYLHVRVFPRVHKKKRHFTSACSRLPGKGGFSALTYLSCFKLNDARSGELLTKEALSSGWRCQQGFKLQVVVFFLSSCCILLLLQP